MLGVKEVDEAAGIWHYQIGKSTGIVKSINMSKTDSPHLPETRFEQDGLDGLKQLRTVYDFIIKTYLDVSAWTGNYIYVEPRGFDPSGKFKEINLTELGLSGYLTVYRTEHVIQPGLAESTLYAKWVAAASSDTIGEPIADAQQKCS